MIRDKEWIDRLAERLAETEVAPPADGWQRLEGALSQTERGVMWIWWRRACIAAALVALVCGVLWYFIPVEPVDENWVAEEVELPASDDAPWLTEQADGLALQEPILANRVTPINPAQSAEKEILSKAKDEVVQLPENQTAEAVATPPSSEVADVVEEVVETTPSKPKEQTATPAKQRDEMLIAQRRVVRPVKRGWRLGVVGGSGAGVGIGAGAADSWVGGDFMQGNTDGAFDADSLLRPLPQEPKQMRRAPWPADYATADLEHYRPWSVGVTVAHELGRGFSLETGLQYTLLRSKVRYRYATERQSLHLLGVPIRLHKELLNAGRFGLYAGAGGVVELPLHSEVGRISVHDRRLQLSLSVVAGARYRLGELTELYFEPDLGYQFTETRLRTIRTENPLTLSLRAGLRFRLRSEK